MPEPNPEAQWRTTTDVATHLGPPSEQSVPTASGVSAGARRGFWSHACLAASTTIEWHQGRPRPGVEAGQASAEPPAVDAGPHFAYRSGFGKSAAGPGGIAGRDGRCRRRPIRVAANAVFRLRTAPVIARVALSAHRLAAASREVAVARWLASERVPAFMHSTSRSPSWDGREHLLGVSFRPGRVRDGRRAGFASAPAPRAGRHLICRRTTLSPQPHPGSPRCRNRTMWTWSPAAWASSSRPTRAWSSSLGVGSFTVT